MGMQALFQAVAKASSFVEHATPPAKWVNFILLSISNLDELLQFVASPFFL
jgi:hypothetical protein